MTRPGSVLCPILVGRDEALSHAEHRLDEVRQGRGGMLLLAGEPGVGKTRLLGSIRRTARATGFFAANGSLAPQDQFLPAALIAELARTLRYSPAWESVGEAILSPGSDGPGDALMRRRRYVHEVVDTITAAVNGPVMLDFEDLQWADEISLEIVGELGRRAGDLPLLVVAAYRLEELPPGSFFREWRARLVGQRTAEEIRLGPLSFDDTAMMTTLILDTGLPAPRDVVAAVYERTDGIPLHVEELLAALPPKAKTDGAAIREARVPDTIEDAILARLEQLSPEAREVARAGSVIGRCFIPSVLAGMMNRPPEDLDGPLRELHQRSFLYEADPGYVDYRHQLLRDVLYRTVPAAELRRLHARAAEFGSVLAGQKELHASAHYERAGLRVEAYGAARAAAEAASEISARREAYELYRRAIANLPEDLPATEEADLYRAFALSAGAIERNDEAQSADLVARERYLEAGQGLEAAETILNNAMLASRAGEPISRCLEEVERAIAELETLPSTPARQALRASSLCVRGHMELAASMLDAARRDAEAARSLAASLDDAETSLDAELLLARIDVAEGRTEGIVDGLRVGRDAREAGFESVGIGGYRNTAILAARVFDVANAEIAIAEGLRYADAIEQSHCRQMIATTAALLQWGAGRWDEADHTARLELVERGCHRGELGALDVVGLVAMGKGSFDEARRWFDESLATGRRSEEVQFILPPLWGLAETDLLIGDARAALGRCDEALALTIRTGERALLIPFVVTGVRAALAARRPDDARRWLGAVGAHLSGWGPAEAALAHSEGLVKLASGSLSAARAALAAAGHGWRERGRTWEATWAQLDLVSCLARLGRHVDATELLASARQTAEQLGSEPLRSRATELGRTVRSRSVEEEPWRPLTAREFEVARLIADGMTNAQIAEALLIAPKTASAHVEHILGKLGVSRRAEIAAWVAQVATSGVTQAAAGAR